MGDTLYYLEQCVAASEQCVKTASLDVQTGSKDDMLNKVNKCQ